MRIGFHRSKGMYLGTDLGTQLGMRLRDKFEHEIERRKRTGAGRGGQMVAATRKVG